MALVGGLVLGLSASFAASREAAVGTAGRLRPVLAFVAGRIGGYVVFGAALGAVGASVAMPPQVTAVLMIAVAVVMVVLGTRLTGISPRVAGWSPPPCRRGWARGSGWRRPRARRAPAPTRAQRRSARSPSSCPAGFHPGDPDLRAVHGVPPARRGTAGHVRRRHGARCWGSPACPRSCRPATGRRSCGSPAWSCSGSRSSTGRRVLRLSGRRDAGPGEGRERGAPPGTSARTGSSGSRPTGRRRLPPGQRRRVRGVPGRVGRSRAPRPRPARPRCSRLASTSVPGWRRDRTGSSCRRSRRASSTTPARWACTGPGSRWCPRPPTGPPPPADLAPSGRSRPRARPPEVSRALRRPGRGSTDWRSRSRPRQRVRPRRPQAAGCRRGEVGHGTVATGPW